MQPRLLLTLAAVVFSAPVWADAPDVPAAPAASVDSVRAEPRIQFHPIHGTVILGNNLARLKVPDTFDYLDPKESEVMLTKVWGNPEGAGTLGMLVPSGEAVDAENGWGVVITYDDDGHVSDEDAGKIDYDVLIQDMRKHVEAVNAQRTGRGFTSVSLVGWAVKPRYDAAARKLYWARELAFGKGDQHTLNYNIRVLGKEGVLHLNAVSGMPQMARIEKLMPTVLDCVEFQPGSRYGDFNASTGRRATYGIAGLVAGKGALKVGFFKGIWVMLLAAKKFVVVVFVVAVFVALTAFVSMRFMRNRER